MNFRWALIIYGALILTFNSGCEKSVALPETIVYGHAGTTISPERWVYPANTRESILYALDVLDADGIEADVQITKDSVLVLYHDAFLDENTTLTGCIPHYNFSELTDLNLYHTKYDLATLEDVFDEVISRKKNIFLDLKPYDYCDSVNVDYAVFNRALNRIFEKYSAQERESCVINATNIYLLNSVTDSSVIKSFETENPQLAVNYSANGWIEEVCLRQQLLTDETSLQLISAGLNITLFGCKTLKEIDRALSYKPKRIVTDNIAYTRKKTK